MRTHIVAKPSCEKNVNITGTFPYTNIHLHFPPSLRVSIDRFLHFLALADHLCTICFLKRLIWPRQCFSRWKISIVAPHYKYWTTNCTESLYSKLLTGIQLRSVIQLLPCNRAVNLLVRSVPTQKSAALYLSTTVAVRTTRWKSFRSKKLNWRRKIESENKTL